MAIDFNDLLEKVGEQYNNASLDLTVKEVDFPHSGKKVYRDFADLAQLQTIVRNQAAFADREENGLMSLIERDFS